MIILQAILIPLLDYACCKLDTIYKIDGVIDIGPFSSYQTGNHRYRIQGYR
jgi:hypothetical protein